MQIQEIAQSIGISATHKSIGELRALIQLKTTQQRIEEKEGKNPTHITVYHPIISTNELFHKTTVTFTDVPFNVDTIHLLINWYLNNTPIEVTADDRVHLTVSALANVSTYDRETNSP